MGEGSTYRGGRASVASASKALGFSAAFDNPHSMHTRKAKNRNGTPFHDLARCNFRVTRVLIIVLLYLAGEHVRICPEQRSLAF